MAEIKHVGRSIKDQRKCAVAYRVVPNDPDNCLVVFTDTLESPDHQTLMQLIESNTGQNANELADAMFRTPLPDGRNMLVQFDRMGKLAKVPTSSIELTPNTTSSIVLSELNQIVAEQKGVTVADLALANAKASTPEAKEEPVAEAAPLSTSADGVLSDEDLAAQYRSQADAMFKEAQRLRKEAEELAPAKKKAKAKTASGG